MVWGIIIGLAVMAAAYCLSMFAYFAARKKWSSAKYSVEIITVLVAYVLSMGAKIAVIIATAPHTFSAGFATIIYSIYSGLGGLAFEGLESLSEIDSAVIQCLYTGTSLYAGLMFVSVFTAKASYEIYSWLQLCFLRIRLKHTDKIDVYLFTAVTEDAVLLANSICEQEQYSKDTKSGTGKARKCKIIFSGDSLDSFDRSDRLHRDIMANGYLYWSYSKKNDDEHAPSILKRLGLYIDNNPCNEASAKSKQSRVHIFSLGKNERLSGLEAENATEVFEEIKAMTEEELSKKNKYRNTQVDFYILTDNDVNYEYYENTLEKIIRDVFDETGFMSDAAEKEKAEAIAKYKLRFQLHIINEALIAGKCLANERVRVLREKVYENKSLLLADNTPNADKTFRAFILGFGGNGREAMKTLFMDTAHVDDGGEPSQFIADVYDLKADQKAGLFASTHPLFICENCPDIEPIKEESVFGKYDRFESIYKPIIQQGRQNGGKIQTFDDVKRYMKFPILGFHCVSCFDLSFMAYLDRQSGEETKYSNKTQYNAFVIALGDDELNISMANSLIDDLKHELLTSDNATGVYPQTVYINIRDEKNYDRINWTEADARNFPSLNVIRFGSRKIIYSYEYIVDDTEDMKYNYGYNEISGSATKIYEDIDADLSKNLAADYRQKVAELSRKFDVDPASLRKDWLKVGMFLKESNAAACRFGAYVEEGLKSEHGPLSAKLLANYAELEHNRWNRFYMANGWIYASYDSTVKAYRRRIKEHTCICPFDSLSLGDKKYDFVNIAIRYKD